MKKYINAKNLGMWIEVEMPKMLGRWLCTHMVWMYSSKERNLSHNKKRARRRGKKSFYNEKMKRK